MFTQSFILSHRAACLAPLRVVLSIEQQSDCEYEFRAESLSLPPSSLYFFFLSTSAVQKPMKIIQMSRLLVTHTGGDVGAVLLLLAVLIV